MLRDALALTEEGARSLRKGALVCAVANLVLMAPVGVFYLVTGEFLAHLEDASAPLPALAPYLLLIVGVLAVSTEPPTVPCTKKAPASASCWPSGCACCHCHFSASAIWPTSRRWS